METAVLLLIGNRTPMPKFQLTPSPAPEGIKPEITATVNGAPVVAMEPITLAPGDALTATQVNVDPHGQRSEPSDPLSFTLPQVPAKPQPPTLTLIPLA